MSDPGCARALNWLSARCTFIRTFFVVLFFVCAGLAGLVAPTVAASAAEKPPPTSTELGQVVLTSLGAGYTVTSQGPISASAFAASPPGQGAVSRALSELGHQISSYRRSWGDSAGTNQVQDLLVRFSTAGSATAFVDSVRHSLDSAQIISENALPSVPGAQRTTYYGATSDAGIGQAVTMRSGDYVDLLSFFSSATHNQSPITASDSTRIAEAQYDAMRDAPGGGGTPAPVAPPAAPGTSTSGVIWAVLAVVILASTLAVPLVLRRRGRTDPALRSEQD